MENSDNLNNSHDITNSSQSNQQNEDAANDFNRIPSNYPNDNNDKRQEDKPTDDFFRIPSNYPDDNQNSNNKPQQATNNTSTIIHTNSNDRDLLKTTDRITVNHRPIKKYIPKKRQITDTESVEEITTSEESAQLPNHLNFPNQEYRLFLLDLEDYEKGPNENGLIQFHQNFIFSSSPSNFDSNSICSHSNSTVIANKDLACSTPKISRATSDYKTSIKLSQINKSYLTHFYKEKPSDFNCQILVSQIKAYMKNSNFALAHFEGFSINDIDGNFVPTVLTERPINGPLSSIFKKMGSLSAAKKFVLICGMTNGLGFIHSVNGFIHSNLNPTTVYVDRDIHPKICDYFFITPFTIKSTTLNNTTVFNYSFDPKLGQSVFQNPLYVAPEILKGENFDQSSDIYSLGLTIFFILAEKEAVLNDEGQIMNYPDGFSELWRQLINRCISRDTKERMTAKAILEELLDNKERMQKYIDSITNTKNELTRPSKIYLMFVKRNYRANFTNKEGFNIFGRMVPNFFEIDRNTRLIISAAELDDSDDNNECLMEVADYFMNGKKNIHKDENWSFLCYQHASERGNMEAKLIVADLYDKGNGTHQNLKRAYDLYEEVLDKTPEDDPKRKEISDILENINYRNTTVKLTNMPTSYSQQKLISLFNRRNHKIKILPEEENEQENEEEEEEEEEGDEYDADDGQKTIQVRIQFESACSLNKAILDIRNQKIKFDNNVPIKYELYKNSLSQSHRFDSLIPVLSRLELSDFDAGKGVRYLHELGKGKFAETFKVVYKKSGKVMAAKVFKNDLNEDNINYLKREIIMASKFDHIAILKYVGFNEHSLSEYYSVHTLHNDMDKRVYNGLYPTIFMEFIPNGTLDEAIENKPSWWNETAKLKAIFGIASAIAQMFALNITHRDLKPLNILMNEFYEPVICDFGCARQYVSDEHNNMSATIGTPIYEAPELMIKDFPPKYTFEVDSFAFGIILFQILTDCPALSVYPSNATYGNIIEYKMNDFKRDPPENTHILFKSLIEACWNVSMKKRPDPPTIYSALIEAINNGDDLLPGAVMTDVIEYVNKLPDIKLD